MSRRSIFLACFLAVAAVIAGSLVVLEVHAAAPPISPGTLTLQDQGVSTDAGNITTLYVYNLTTGAIVGINTNNPVLAGTNVGLVIAGNTTDSAVRLLNGQTNGRTMELLDTISGSTGGLQIHAPAGNVGEFVQYDGKLGVNTLTPSAWLHVKGVDGDGSLVTISGSNVALTHGFDSAGNGHAYIGTSGANDLVFNTSNTARVTIDKNGAVNLAGSSVGTALGLGGTACVWGTAGVREINVAGCDNIGNPGLVLNGASATASPYINFKNNAATVASLQYSSPAGTFILDAPAFQFTTGYVGIGPNTPHSNEAFEQASSVTSAAGAGYGMFLRPTMTVGNGNEIVVALNLKPTVNMNSKAGASAYGLVSDGTTWTVSNTVSTNAGFAAYTDAPTAFNANWNVYANAGKNYFGGNTGFGTNTQSQLTSLINLGSGSDAAHGIQWGTDTDLYRQSASRLKTDGDLFAGNDLAANAGSTTGQIRLNTAGIKFAAAEDTRIARGGAGYVNVGDGSLTHYVGEGINADGNHASMATITLDGDTTVYRAYAGDVKTDGSITIGSSGASTCDSSHRGEEQFVAGASGAADIMRLCMKSSADTYSWKTIVTG